MRKKEKLILFNLDKDSHNISLSQLEKLDIIEYDNENIEKSMFLVLDSSIDEKIPALLLQLWKFEGGYDHAFANVMEVNFDLKQELVNDLSTIFLNKGENKVDSFQRLTGADTETFSFNFRVNNTKLPLIFPPQSFKPVPWWYP